MCSQGVEKVYIFVFPISNTLFSNFQCKIASILPGLTKIPSTEITCPQKIAYDN